MWLLGVLGIFVVLCLVLMGLSVGIGYILTLLVSSIDMGSATVAGAIISIACIYFVYAVFNMAINEALERKSVDDFYNEDEGEDEGEEIFDAIPCADAIPSLIKSDFFHSRHSNTNNTPKRKKRRKRKK